MSVKWWSGILHWATGKVSAVSSRFLSNSNIWFTRRKIVCGLFDDRSKSFEYLLI